jgi:hypothetical protein
MIRWILYKTTYGDLGQRIERVLARIDGATQSLQASFTAMAVHQP